MTKPVRVRFAPSPTGALHIGGVRTALYNYLWAKKNGGTFILRVEDTDQTRFVAGAEDYIVEALAWFGLNVDESPQVGGKYAPYRQSERKALGIYAQYAQKLIENGKAYYAFDTPEALDERRKAEEAAGNKGFKYDATSRLGLRNSLSLPKAETDALLAQNAAYVIRLRVERDEIIEFDDIIRGHIQYNSNELDDKVLLKSDGMPTYHLANIIDDYEMQISHVIRGEEWLPSTPTHVLLYRAFGWADKMPLFAHLPLILRPDGKGKLSKRDGAKFGIPVFPLNFPLRDANAETKGFREWGFEPDAALNFLALLGWSAGDDREFYSLDELVQAFDLANINKSGARFDFDKAKWFNQQYLMRQTNEALGVKIQNLLQSQQPNADFSVEYCAGVAAMLKERVHFLTEFYQNGKYFFNPVDFEQTQATEGADLQKKVLAKWDAARKTALLDLVQQLEALPIFDATTTHDAVMAFMEATGLKMGELMPILRLGLSGTMKGAGVFEMIALFGKAETAARLRRFFDFADLGSK
jgi:glutamyl-tRNA synthetase